jgi:triacylglycerol lipase
MIEVPELSVLSHLTYVAYKRGCDVVEQILKNGEASFAQSYTNIAFLNANRLFKPEITENCCGFIAINDNDIVIAIRGTENLDDFFYDLLALTDSEKDSIHLGFSMYVDSFFSKYKTS